MQLQTIGRWSLINLLVFVPLAIVLAGSAGAMTTNQVLWRNTNGDVNLWMMSGGAISSSTDLGVIPANWTIQGVGDFNGDGTPDILWRNSNGDVVIWFMTASSIASTAHAAACRTPSASR